MTTKQKVITAEHHQHEIPPAIPAQIGFVPKMENHFGQFSLEVIALDFSFVLQLEQLGITTPVSFVNKFGLSLEMIAETFWTMGSSFVLSHDTHLWK